MTAEQKIKYLPAGGIAGFVMSDEQVEQLEAEELQEQYGTAGIAQFSTIGKNMANFGRHGDDTVAHVETGELIVPRALIENNPKLKESIFQHLRELGVEDPERYVVGESKNSLNPTTGLPEFFFKKLFKSVSKMVKSVGKILKKAAPIIIPIALNFIAPGLGAVWSGAIGSGIATLVQGGSIKDAFKSALIGGATGALTAGFSGSGDFMSNVSADVSMGTTNIGNAFSQGSFAPLQSTTGPSIEGLFDGKSSINNADMASTTVDSSDFATSASGQQPGTFGADGSVQVAGDNIYPDLGRPSSTNVNGYRVDARGNYVSGGGTPLAKPVDSNVFGVDNFSNYQPPAMDPYQANALKLEGVDVGVGGNQTITSTKPKSMFETFTDKASEYGSKTSDLMFGTDATQAELFAKAGQFQKDALAKGYTLSSKEAMALAQKQLNPGIIRKYGPSLALAGVAGVAGGMFDVPEEEKDKPIRTGMDVYNENPDLYNVGDLEPLYIAGDSNVGTKYPYYRPRTSRRPDWVVDEVQNSAQGGQIFPRRVGGIMPNEGIPNQDSVRAMLMPGEFVMTTDAVKGLGGGDMNKGINNMYGVMRNLEQRGRRA
jgi:hypothetical protein